MTLAAPTDSSRHGVGLGLRWEFLDDLLERIELGRISREDLPFFEFAPENYLRRGGFIPEALDRVRAAFPLVSHGLHLSLGSVSPFPSDYLEHLRRMLAHVAAPWHSDHLCFSGTDERSLHDLLPLPQTEGAALHVAKRVREARERLERPMAIENISWYTRVGETQLDETAFISLILEEADCGMLLDVNNVFVNATNHGFDAKAWIDRIDPSRVWQLHVAGHEWRPSEELIIDTHGAPVVDPVVELLCYTVARTGPVSVVLERDSNIGSLDALLEERRRLQAAYDDGLAQYRTRQAEGAHGA
jgi:uncharacterized protein (UPF0276 family)